MSEPVVPVIDIEPFRIGGPEERRAVAQDFDKACREIGFIVVSGHGVPEELTQRTFEVMAAFFAQPEADKRKAMAANGNLARGFVPNEGQALAYSLDEETPPDLFERYSIGRVDVPDDDYHRSRRDSFFQENIWPADILGFEETLSAYYRAQERLAATLMEIFARALDLPDDFFAPSIDKHVTSLAINHYPPQPSEPLPGQLRAGAHSDYGSLTILRPQDAPGGLQVRDSAGAWRDVTPVPGTFIINLGDLMAQWTNDRWVSTMHRVVNPPRDVASDARRISLVFFHQPNDDARIECLPSCCSPDNPPKYAPTTSGEHLMMKIRKQRVAAE